MNRVLPVLLLLLLLLWWLWPRDKGTDGASTADPMSAPNVVSRQDQPNTSPTQESNRPTHTSSQSNGPKTTVVTGAQTAAADEPSALTYLDVYRKTRLFNRCRQTIYRFLRDANHDPLNELQNKLNRLTPANQISPQPTAKQTAAVISHHEQCARLLAEIDRLESAVKENDSPHVDDLFKQKREALQMWLAQTRPKTAKEQAIAETLRLKQAWNNHFDALIQVSIGDDSQHPEAIAALNEQAAQVQAQMDDILEQMRQTEDKELLQDQLGDLSQQYNEIQAEINELNWVDPDKRAQHLAFFDAFSDQLYDQLSSRDPDVFFETQMALEKTNRTQYFGHSPYKDIGKYRAKMPLIEYVSPGDVVMQALEMTDPDVFRLVIQHATQLYHCELGADCGPDSEWIEYYCFASYDEIDAISCDLDLTTYLRQHRLNDNQWQDVNWVLDMLRSLYAA
ncbi:hypothetical protein [Marinicella meishanensis]|uniref:hypothetical protein n=1 Tax=Marinicella meishanensis TaxID=2873263 RepID=UPI001CBDCD52|nr:hypothetical protein [Marinicella sp. NBU2979]